MRSFGEKYGMCAMELISEYVLFIIREAHYPSVSEDDRLMSKWIED